MLNIRSNTVIKTPPSNAKIIKTVNADKIIIVDAMYLDQEDNTTIESIIAQGTGTTGQKTFSSAGALPKPTYRTEDSDGYIDISNSHISTNVFANSALSEPITYAYVVRVNDWDAQEADWAGASTKRMFSLGNSTVVRHLAVPSKNGIMVAVGSSNPVTIMEKPSDWFVHVVHFNGTNSRVVNSAGEILNISLNTSDPAYQFFIGSTSSATSGLTDVNMKNWTVYSGAMTDDELLTIYNELTNMI